MFSHHILKPERTPLEAHPWGTIASSGSFSTLFKSRLLRVLEYKESPHDLVGAERVFGISMTLNAPVVQQWSEFTRQPNSSLVVGKSSAHLDLPDAAIDLVVNDPPYLDNVHYSELADSFHAWLRGVRPFEGYPTELSTTRAEGEVQSADSDEFAKAIEDVWQECARVLKEDGILAFTFHQARAAGWSALVTALRNAGFVITAVQPVKGELSVATPKSGASDPSNLDAVIVCRKTSGGVRPSVDRVVTELRECRDAGVAVGWSDIQSVVRGAVVASYTDPTCDRSLDDLLAEAGVAADRVCAEFAVSSQKLKA
ncbi:adenine-specific DNA methylase [Hamadaea flava]|uniref:Uncharacterized protein n=1 Tax=Hamadaea flava TaxID=1742688 RepID=A0ABV8LI43_9ACTN|nr:hypothetical protein [Hamadaea flava]MCP2325246.1 adenine-specific DNA methylase [Hamadaea flava]